MRAVTFSMCVGYVYYNNNNDKKKYRYGYFGINHSLIIYKFVHSDAQLCMTLEGIHFFATGLLAFV